MLFLIYTSKLFSILEKKLYGYAVDNTLLSAGPSPPDRALVDESLNRDRNTVVSGVIVWERD